MRFTVIEEFNILSFVLKVESIILESVNLLCSIFTKGFMTRSATSRDKISSGCPCSKTEGSSAAYNMVFQFLGFNIIIYYNYNNYYNIYYYNNI